MYISTYNPQEIHRNPLITHKESTYNWNGTSKSGASFSLQTFPCFRRGAGVDQRRQAGMLGHRQ